MKPFSLEIAGELSSIPTLHRFLEHCAGKLAIGADDLYDLRLAVEEAVTNTVNHGYAGRPGKIRVEVSREDTTVTVHLWDEAREFDTAACPPAGVTGPLSERPAGGRGLYLLRESVDAIRHEPAEGGGNHITLIKELSGHSG